MEDEFNRVALATGQRGTAVAEAAGTLIAAGMDRALVRDLLPTIARVATGANASMNDLSRTAFALSSNMGVTGAEMEATLASLMRLGMEGRFELRDMARTFSSLSAAAGQAGAGGRAGAISLGAMLQVALRGAGTADEAANNLQNFISKLTSPETVRNFARMGVNLERVMQDAARQGINPIEAVIQKVRELTGGNAFQIGELFGDMQVLNFLRPMMANVPEYLRLVREGTAATSGLIDGTVRSQQEGPFRQLEVFFERMEQFGRRIGTALMPAVGAINGALERLSAWAADIDARFPGLIDGATLWGGALLTVVAALGGILTVAGPFGLVAAALAGAGLLIYQNWDSIVGVFRRLQAAWDRFWSSEQIQEGARIMGAIGDALSGVWDRAGAALGRFAAYVGERIAAVVSYIQPVIDLVQRLINLLPSLPSLPSAGPTGPTPREGGAGNALRRTSLYPPEAAGGAGEQRVSGEIVVRAAPGTEVVETRTRNPGVPIVAPNRGAIVAVP
jgi:TP901 family phage tail tape measure protein